MRKEEEISLLWILSGVAPPYNRPVGRMLGSEAESVGAQVESQSMSSIVGLLPSLEDQVLDVGRSLPWGLMRAAGAIFQAREALRPHSV